ncbi:MAG: hypothetical protein DHS20C14_12570 [Phycisphaeraceae bacterium]|nr:MAG: hypothetical protein DHS20C14_12570 [Phycisphaeraceae bacterium]
MMALWDWIQLAAGLALGVGGFYVLRSSRTRGDAVQPRPLPFGAWSPSVPTRYAIGISLLLGAYHLVAYALPDTWVPLKVPLDRFWILASALTLAVGVSILIDFLDGDAPLIEEIDPPSDDPEGH